MLSPEYANQFNKDLKKAQKRGKDIEKLKCIIKLLISETPLPAQNRDRYLNGDYKGFRECHIEPDWLLIYKVDKSYIIFDRIGTHSDLF